MTIWLAVLNLFRNAPFSFSRFCTRAMARFLFAAGRELSKGGTFRHGQFLSISRGTSPPEKPSHPPASKMRVVLARNCLVPL